MGDKVEIRKIDVGIDSEQTRQYAAKYDIQFVPTLVIEKDGALIRKLVGVQSLETLESILKRSGNSSFRTDCTCSEPTPNCRR